jgi:hypothetical protein
MHGVTFQQVQIAPLRPYARVAYRMGAVVPYHLRTAGRLDQAMECLVIGQLGERLGFQFAHVVIDAPRTIEVWGDPLAANRRPTIRVDEVGAVHSSS